MGQAVGAPLCRLRCTETWTCDCDESLEERNGDVSLDEKCAPNLVDPISVLPPMVEPKDRLPGHIVRGTATGSADQDECRAYLPGVSGRASSSTTIVPAVPMPMPWCVANEPRMTPTLLADWTEQNGARGKPRAEVPTGALPQAACGGSADNEGGEGHVSGLQPRVLSRPQAATADANARTLPREERLS
mmetsp:Transcript_979/g.2497  ORF Transcript_979/g.2497 Transcript_979/m.2497 type:complete len:189 (-) Transcript_979:178-744(-)